MNDTFQMYFFGSHQREILFADQTASGSQNNSAFLYRYGRFYEPHYPKYAEEDRGIAAWPQVTSNLGFVTGFYSTVGKLWMKIT